MVPTDARWAVLEPLVEADRPRAKVPPSNLRRTMSAILRRRANGAEGRAVPAELGPWWTAAQTLIRRTRLGVGERLLRRVQARRVELGVTFLDGTRVRAHRKAAGAVPKRPLAWRRRRQGPRDRRR
jgi:transposase